MRAIDSSNQRTVVNAAYLPQYGGGIRGLITLGILEKLEAELRTETRAGKDFALSDYFDNIGSTSAER